jgi:hypothetical protein
MPTYAEKCYRMLAWFFARNAMCEAVVTRVHFDASPQAVWNHIMLYEEVPGHPPLLLRALLPQPTRTEGHKTRVGETVRCIYTQGDLVKRIITVEPPHALQFEVIAQRLGIERCILTLGGSYQIHRCGDAADVVLTTNYWAYLRPRFLWRPVEAFLVGKLHRHIVGGVGAAVISREPAFRPSVVESRTPKCAPLGDLECIALPSRSRR